MDSSFFEFRFLLEIDQIVFNRLRSLKNPEWHDWIEASGLWLGLDFWYTSAFFELGNLEFDQENQLFDEATTIQPKQEGVDHETTYENEALHPPSLD